MSAHTARVIEVGYDENSDRHFIAMEYVDGERLDVATARGKMDPARVRTILLGICDSISEAHRKNIIHRDIKPLNIVFSNDSRTPDFVKVLDFGIAERYSKSEDLGAKASERFGTTMYMAPEVRNYHLPTKKSDVYAIGLVALQCLAGTKYLPDEYLNAERELIVESDFDIGHLVPSNELVPGWSLEQSNNARGYFVNILQRMLSYDPARRQNIDELIRKLSLAATPRSPNPSEAPTPIAAVRSLVSEDQIKTADVHYEVATSEPVYSSLGEESSGLKVDMSHERVTTSTINEPSNIGVWAVVFGLLAVTALGAIVYVLSQSPLASPGQTEAKIKTNSVELVDKPSRGSASKVVPVKEPANEEDTIVSEKTTKPVVVDPPAKVIGPSQTTKAKQKPATDVSPSKPKPVKKEDDKVEPKKSTIMKPDDLSIDDYAPPGLYDLK